MMNVNETVDAYLAAWNEPDPGCRLRLIEQAWAPEGRLIDPPLAASGYAEINDMVSALHAQFPGHRFRRASGIDAHHDQLRFAWELLTPAGSVALAGVDVGERADDGRLQRVCGFFGELAVSA